MYRDIIKDNKGVTIGINKERQLELKTADGTQIFNNVYVGKFRMVTIIATDTDLIVYDWRNEVRVLKRGDLGKFILEYIKYSGIQAGGDSMLQSEYVLTSEWLLEGGYIDFLLSESHLMTPYAYEDKARHKDPRHHNLNILRIDLNVKGGQTEYQNVLKNLGYSATQFPSKARFVLLASQVACSLPSLSYEFFGISYLVDNATYDSLAGKIQRTRQDSARDFVMLIQGEKRECEVRSRTQSDEWILRITKRVKDSTRIGISTEMFKYGILKI